MEPQHNSRKRAITITIIVVAILLLVVYILSQTTTIFGTKGSSTSNKSFIPLLGTSKQKAVNPIDQGEEVTLPTGTVTQTTGGGEPTNNPLPTPNGKGPFVVLSVTPKTLPVAGGKIKLTWQGENVISCIPRWTGKKITQTSGTSNEITVKKTRVFGISCANGQGQQASASTQVTVGENALQVSLRATPNTLIESGNVVLTWTSKSTVKSCTPGWTNKKDAAQGEVTVPVSQSQTFLISCTDGALTEIAEADVVVGSFEKTPQCRDGVDNDGDNAVDALDSACHSNFDASDDTSYVPTIADEARLPTETTNADRCKIVDDNPLTFTDVEKRQLDLLLRQFYRIAPNLKTEDDVVFEKEARLGYIDLVKEVKSLTKQCYAQQYPAENNAVRVALGATPNYTGPLEKKTNPYFQPDGVVSSPSYITKSYIESKFTAQQNTMIAQQALVVSKLDAKIKSAQTNAQAILFTQLRNYEQNILDQFKNNISTANQFILIEKLLQVW